jgi:hypothetical protein
MELWAHQDRRLSDGGENRSDVAQQADQHTQELMFYPTEYLYRVFARGHIATQTRRLA